jgi:3-hydroxybutyryl-CoA dehydratase
MSDALTFEQLEVGRRWVSPARTITETDVVNFACLTGDFDPLHVDHEHARNSPFRRPIAHGLLGLTFVAGLGSHYPRAATVAFVQIRQWQFLKPIFFGDTVHVVNEVLETEATGRLRGRVVWKRSLLNHNQETVQEGILETVVARRVAGKSDGSEK